MPANEPSLSPPTPRKRHRSHIPLLVGLLLLSLAIFVLNRQIPFLPSKVRVEDNRTICASRLHQIGLGILLYTGDFQGQYPDSFPTLLLKEQVDSYAFICPASDAMPSTAPTTQAQADDLTAPTHMSYIYLGQGLTEKTALPNQVIAYERLKNHGDGICVLCGDGHAEFAPLPRAQSILNAAATTRPVMLSP